MAVKHESGPWAKAAASTARQVHETLHAEGVVRLSTLVKIGTRTDEEPTLAGKLF